MQGLEWQVITVPFVGGLQQKTDPRALPPPGLSRAVNVECDEIGGLQTRKPFTEISNAIAGGGTISTFRRIFGHGGELLAFDQTALYSWDAQATKWIRKGTHLAIKVGEETVCSTTGDQVTPDRAELNNFVVYAWTDTNKVYVSVRDKTTGAEFMAPTAINGTGTRPRLVALATKILLFWHAGTDAAPGNILVYSIDPTTTNPSDLATDLGTPVSTTVLAAASSGSNYDVTRILTTDTAIFVAKRLVTTSYEIAKISNSGGVTASTKARDCNGVIAVSSDPTGATVQVIRTNGTSVIGDRITVSSLADAAINQAIGTSTTGTPHQIAACHRSVQNSGAYRCYVFWSDIEEIGFTVFRSEYNYVDTAGTIGTQAVLIRRMGIASRAFDYNGEVYVWGVFTGTSSFSGAGSTLFRAQLQNTVFLYRDDGFLCAKAAPARAGGSLPLVGHLPHVALTSGTTTYSWCTPDRSVINLGAEDQTNYGARSPLDITFTFDSDEARRVARLGSTLYISGGEILQYDGTQLTECGFHIYPWSFVPILLATGAVDPGTYAIKVTWRWNNARGEIDRSTTATVATFTTASALPNGIEIIDWTPLYITHKTSRPIAVEVWRTVAAPTDDAPFYLVTSKDPSVVANPNRYVANDPTADALVNFQDELADSVLLAHEANNENGSILENTAPPPATILIASDTRIFLAGITGDPHRIRYSKLRGDGQVAGFHESLAVDVPRDGGDITALAIHEETLVVFRERAIYALPGDGFDNTSQGQNYGPARTIATDVGAISHETVARTPLGTVFKSSKGWYLVRGWSVEYIGAAVSDYDSETVVAVHVVEKQHQVRIMSSARVLVWDYLANQWFEWTIASGVHAAMWNGTYTVAKSTVVSTEATSYSGVDYGIDVESAWIKLADLQGYGSVRWFELLGELRSSHLLKIRSARDYREYSPDRAGVDHKDFTPPIVVGDPLRLRRTPSFGQDLQAIKVRVTSLSTSSVPATMTTATGGNWTAGGTITTDSSVWTATLAARFVGDDGERLSIFIYASVGRGVEVRDDYRFDGGTGNWVAREATVGVRVGSNATIGQLEQAINDTSRLIRVSVPDATPGKLIAGSGQHESELKFIGGTEVAPTGECLKLTGISFEVGLKRGTTKRLPAAQTG